MSGGKRVGSGRVAVGGIGENGERGGLLSEVQGGTSPGEPGLGWTDGKLADVAEQVCKMGVYPKSRLTQPRFYT